MHLWGRCGLVRSGSFRKPIRKRWGRAQPPFMMGFREGRGRLDPRHGRFSGLCSLAHFGTAPFYKSPMNIGHKSTEPKRQCTVLHPQAGLSGPAFGPIDARAAPTTTGPAKQEPCARDIVFSSACTARLPATSAPTLKPIDKTRESHRS